MKKMLLIISFIVFALMVPVAQARQRDLRQYPGPGRGVVIMGADIPPSWFLDVWVNPVMADGKPQGIPNIVFIPHPSYQQRSKDCSAGKETGSVIAHVEAWEYDRAGNRVVRAVKYPLIAEVRYTPDYEGYYWRMYIGLNELGVNQHYSTPLIPPIWTPPPPPCDPLSPPWQPYHHYPPHHPPYHPRR